MPSGLSNGANARALVSILQVSLSSSRSLTLYVGASTGLVFSLVRRDCMSNLVLATSPERFWTSRGYVSACRHLLNDGITHAIVFDV